MQPAEVVCYARDPQWHEERRKLITGTVAPILLGCQRYGSLLSTYLRMRGVDADEPGTPREVLDWGTDLEGAVIPNIARRLGLKARPENALLRSREYPRLGATIDGWVEDAHGELCTLNVKSSRSPMQIERWDEGVPDEVDAQAQHEMLVVGSKRCLVAATICGEPPRYAWIERNQDRIDRIILAAQALLHAVDHGEPPEPDGSDDAARALERAYPTRPGTEIALSIEAVELSNEIEDLSAQIDLREQRKAEARQQIRAMMGTAQVGRMPGDAGVWRCVTTERKPSISIVGLGVDEVRARLAGTTAKIRSTEGSVSSYIRRGRA